MLAHTSSSLGQYSWNQRGPSPLAAPISSIEYEAAVDMIIGTPRSAAARAVASSPSGCRIDWTPMGANSTGAGIGVPSTLVASERFVASRSIRGTSRHRSNAARLARAVAPEPAAPSTYQNGPGSIAARADSASADVSVLNAGRTWARPCR
jgi:hypothetical protein